MSKRSYRIVLKAAVRVLILASAFIVTTLAFAQSGFEPDGRDRTFDFYVFNGTNEPVTFVMTNVSGCYEGTPGQGAIFNLASGAHSTIFIARVQGHGCDGENGYFTLTPTNPRFLGGSVEFAFDNGGSIWVTRNYPDGFHGELSSKNSDGRGGYFWTLLGAEAKLNQPSIHEPDGRDRTFDLYVNNALNEPVNVEITSVSGCYEGSPGQGATFDLPSGNYMAIWIARVQGHGCDGENGYFTLRLTSTTFAYEDIGFGFTNDGGIWNTNLSNAFHSVFTRNSDGSYFWTIRDVEARLSMPVDSRLTQPQIRVATDTGTWSTSSTVDSLLFLNQPGLGLWGNFYDDCVGYELFHPQHVVRLPNKDGRAYFMVAQSRAHNGWITVLQTDPGVLDPATDLITSQGDRQRVGQYIWQDLYTGSFNGTINPVGNWNHPGKMEVMDGILLVAAQNWAEGAPCFYGKGETTDKVLFYDVRDPETPRYWGAITAQELGVPEISNLGLTKTPDGIYWLQAGGGGNYATWSTWEISPNIEDWTQKPPGSAVDAQHGMIFNSYQYSTTISSSSPSNGIERIVYFDSSGEGQTVGFSEYAYDASSQRLTPTGSISYPANLIGANRDWDSDSLYVTEYGMPVIYSMESASGQHGILFQISDINNVGNAVTNNAGASVSAGLNYSATPNFGSAQLAPGFTPDPYGIEVTSGGSVDVSRTLTGSDCTGYATEAPDFSLEWAADGASPLRILVVAEGDTTLIVNGPRGNWFCNDDADGHNPMVEFESPVSGRYDIWIGSYESNTANQGTLYITERPLSPGDFLP